MVDLANTRVLVLGGSGALGSRLARRLQAAGAQVAIAGRDRGRIESAASDIGATPVVVDLTQPGTPEQLIAEVVSLLGGIDGVVNAAGVVAFGELSATSDATIDEIFAADLIGPLRVIREATKRMDNGGFIVNLTGVVAEQPPAGMVVYSAAKAGLSAASKALARELRRGMIHVLDARPPHTETGLATRPIAGESPPLPEGLDPDVVADAIIAALQANKRELAAADFA